MLELEDATCLAFAEEQTRIGYSQSCASAGSDTPVSCAASCGWRERVAQWFYDLIDHLGENRELAYIAMNILDRYTGCSCPSDERLYEVEAMSALFLAVRIGGSGNLALGQLVSMSRHGRVLEKDIIAMGKSMISTLSWDQRILTPADFVRLYVDNGAPALLTTNTRDSLLDSAMYLVELAVFDLALARKRPSQLAAAATLTAIKRLSGFHPESKASLISAIAVLAPSRFCDLSALQDRLERISNDDQAERERKSHLPHVIMDEEDDDEVMFCVNDDSSRPSRMLPMVSDPNFML